VQEVKKRNNNLTDKLYGFEVAPGKEGSDGTTGEVPGPKSDMPVTDLTLGEVIVGLNALSIIQFLNPVYVDKNGVVKKASNIDWDTLNATRNNGYRLPQKTEWLAAAKLIGQTTLTSTNENWAVRNDWGRPAGWRWFIPSTSTGEAKFDAGKLVLTTQEADASQWWTHVPVRSNTPYVLKAKLSCTSCTAHINVFIRRNGILEFYQRSSNVTATTDITLRMTIPMDVDAVRIHAHKDGAGTMEVQDFAWTKEVDILKDSSEKTITADFSNLLQNGNAEDGINNWTKEEITGNADITTTQTWADDQKKLWVIEGGSSFVISTKSQKTQQGVFFHKGMAGTAPQQTARLYQDVTGVERGKMYRLSGWIACHRCESYLRVEALDSAGVVWHAEQSPIVSGTFSETLRSIVFVTPQETTKVRVSIVKGRSVPDPYATAYDDYVYADALKLEKVQFSGVDQRELEITNTSESVVYSVCAQCASGAVDATDASTKAVAWYADNANGKTQFSKTKQKNPVGLYDMSGNVAEWVYDPASASVYGGTAVSQITKVTSNSFKNLGRDTKDSFIGFRSVRTDVAKKIISFIGEIDEPIAGRAAVTQFETEQYTATVNWSFSLDSGILFKADTTYTATITLTPKEGYSLVGLPENYFTVLGASQTNYVAGTNTITAIFIQTDKTISDTQLDFGPSIDPVLQVGQGMSHREGYTVSVIDNDKGAIQYKAGIEKWEKKVGLNWQQAIVTEVEPDTQYRVTIRVVPETRADIQRRSDKYRPNTTLYAQGYTLHGLAANTFTLKGVPLGQYTVEHLAGDGEVVVTFVPTPKTITDTNISTSLLPYPEPGEVVTEQLSTSQYEANVRWLSDEGLVERAAVYNGNGNKVNYANRPVGWHPGQAEDKRTKTRLFVNNGVMYLEDPEQENTFMFTDVTAKPNTNYILTGDIACDQCDAQIHVHYVQNGLTKRVDHILPNNAKRADLEQFRISVHVPDGVTRVRIFIVKVTKGEQLLVDNVQWRQDGIPIDAKIEYDPTNLVRNPGAETLDGGNIRDWKTWQNVASPDNVIFTQSRTLAVEPQLWTIDGERSFVIATKNSVFDGTSGSVGSDYDHATYYQDINIDPNTTYRLRGMMNCHRCIGYMEAELFSHETDDTQSMGVYANVGTTNHELNWDGTEKNYSVFFKTPANAKRVRIHLTKHHSHRDNFSSFHHDYFFADDIALQKVTKIPYHAMNDARFDVLPDGGVKERDMIYNGNGNLINYANRPLGWHMGNSTGDRTNSILEVKNGVMEFTDTLDNGWMFTDATVKPNKKYVLSGLIGCEGCQSQIDVHFIKDKTSTRTVYNLPDDAEHSLKSFEVRGITVPEGVTRVRIYFVKQKGGGKLKLDNVSWRQEGVAIEERIAVDPSYGLKNYNAEDEVISTGNGMPKHWSEWKSQTAEYGACTTTDVLIDDRVLWAMEGKRSINIQTRSSVDTIGNVHVHAACYQDVKVLPNKTYLLRGMLNCHRCIGFLEAELFSHETDDTKRIGVGASVATTNHELTFDGTEKYYSVVFKTPANAKRARIHIIKHDSKPDANNNNTAKHLDYLFADDIALQEVTDLPLGAIDADALGGQKKFSPSTVYVPMIDIVAKEGFTLSKSGPFTWDGENFEVGPSHTNYYSDALFADDISLKKWGTTNELVKNGNAENGTNDWNERTRTGATAIHTTNRDFWTISGTASLMIATPSQIKAGGDQHHGDFYQDIDVDPNQTYVLKGKINCHRCEGALYVEERTATGGLLRSGAHVQDFPWEIIRHHWKNNNPTNFASFLNNDKAVRTINRVFVTSPSTDKVRIVIYKGNSTNYFAEGLLLGKEHRTEQVVEPNIIVPVAKYGAVASAGDVIDTGAGMDVEVTKWEVLDGTTWTTHTGHFVADKKYRVLLTPKRKGSTHTTTKGRTLYTIGKNHFIAKDRDMGDNNCNVCITSTLYDGSNFTITVEFREVVRPVPPNPQNVKVDGHKFKVHWGNWAGGQGNRDKPYESEYLIKWDFNHDKNFYDLKGFRVYYQSYSVGGCDNFTNNWILYSNHVGADERSLAIRVPQQEGGCKIGTGWGAANLAYRFMVVAYNNSGSSAFEQGGIFVVSPLIDVKPQQRGISNWALYDGSRNMWGNGNAHPKNTPYGEYWQHNYSPESDITITGSRGQIFVEYILGNGNAWEVNSEVHLIPYKGAEETKYPRAFKMDDEVGAHHVYFHSADSNGYNGDNGYASYLLENKDGQLFYREQFYDIQALNEGGPIGKKLKSVTLKLLNSSRQTIYSFNPTCKNARFWVPPDAVRCIGKFYTDEVTFSNVSIIPIAHTWRAEFVYDSLIGELRYETETVPVCIGCPSTPDYDNYN
jgi:hypothetical protein